MLHKALAIALLLLGSTQVLAGGRNKDQSFKNLPSFQYYMRGKSSHPELKAYIKDLQKLHADRGNITAHILAHSHDDVGWLKTVDEYFTGQNDDVVHASVENIISTVIQNLIDNPDRRFTQVEMKFFSMWWKTQTDDMKNQVRMLAQQKRLEFVNAGWSMHDEACTHYEDMINNMYIGHQWLLNEIGVKPRIGWHVDPFGHSSANPRLFAEMGFDAWFFGRLDYQDKIERLRDLSMEFIWQPFLSHLNTSAQIFTHSMLDNYCFVGDMWWDDRWNDDGPVVDNPDLETYNVEFKTDMMIANIYEKLPVYQGSHMLLSLGCDFAFGNAAQNFVSLDRLIAYFNKNVKNMTLVYSTPGYYLDAIKKQNMSYPVKTDDMFPYADFPGDFWTGYFTSRANAKGQVRQGQASMHASNKLYTLRVLDVNASDDMINQTLAAQNSMMDTMGIFQHHDAVTGTARQHVANDYNFRMWKSITKVNNPVYTQAIQDFLLSQKTQVSSNQWLWCERYNGTYLDCPIAQYQQSNFLISAHNPSLADQKYIKVKVPHGNYSLQYWDVASQKYLNLAQSAVICVQRVRESEQRVVNDCELHAKTLVAAQSFALILVKYNSTADLTVKAAQKNLIGNKIGETLFYIGYDDEGVKFDMLKDSSGNIYTIGFDIMNYFSQQNMNILYGSNSGAYLFKPSPELPTSVRYTVLRNLTTYNGGFVQEMFMSFTSDSIYRNATAFVRLRYYDESPTSDWEVHLSGLPNDGRGREVTVNWKCYDIKNGGVFYTDSNGLEMQRRVLNYRPSWNYSSYEKVSGNYYPVNSAISIVDEKKRVKMTVLNDRSQGGSALQDGHIELMQNRRIFFDDSRGVEEPLDETDKYGNGITVSANYRLLITDMDFGVAQTRNLQLAIDEPLQYFFALKWNTTQNKSQINDEDDFKSLSELKTNIGAVSNPYSVKYEVFPIKRNQIFLRVENIGDKFDTDYNGLNKQQTTVQFPLDSFAKELFSKANWNNTKFNLTSVIYQEMALTANQLYSDGVAGKTNWNIRGFNSTQLNPFPVATNFSQIELVQQRIRMFNITYVVKTSSSFEREKLY